MIKSYKFYSLLLVTIFFAVNCFAKTIVIVNPSLGVDEISKGELAKIYLGDSSKWPDGSKVNPVDQNKDKEVTKSFLENVIGMSSSEFQSIWIEKMLSGEASPPSIKGSDQDVIDFVKNNKGAVGYILKESNTDAVKTLTVDGKKEW